MNTRIIIAAALACLALAGCSSSSDDKADPARTPPAAAPAATTSTPTPTPADEVELTAAVTAYTKAFFEPDAAAAYALLSARCKKDTSVTQLRTVLATSAAMYGAPAVKNIEVNQIAVPLARVTVHYVTPPMPETPQSWTREHGGWKYDAC